MEKFAISVASDKHFSYAEVICEIIAERNLPRM
jgi:hypothetical protein